MLLSLLTTKHFWENVYNLWLIVVFAYTSSDRESVVENDLNNGTIIIIILKEKTRSIFQNKILLFPRHTVHTSVYTIPNNSSSKQTGEVPQECFTFDFKIYFAFFCSRLLSIKNKYIFFYGKRPAFLFASYINIKHNIIVVTIDTHTWSIHTFMYVQNDRSNMLLKPVPVTHNVL